MNQIKKKKSIYWKIGGIVLADILAAALCVGVVVLFHYVLPQQYEGTGTVLSGQGSKTEKMFTLPGEETTVQETGDAGQETKAPNSSGGRFGSTGENKVNTKNTGTGMIDAQKNATLETAEKTKTQLGTNRTEHYDLTISKYEVGEGEDKITYYAADLYVSNVQYLQTAFAEGKYGKNIRAYPDEISEENQALFAISGDFYGNSTRGVVIRNGILYRQNVNDADICVLYLDGTMETYSPEEFDGDVVIARGAWQAWTFGPQLLDGTGSVLDSFLTTPYLNKENPRCAIGYVEPGHYMLVTVDGRQEGYSRGVTITELAQLMADLGCKTAYNLDGGNSACMYYNGSYVNQSSGDERAISDIIYVGKE